MSESQPWVTPTTSGNVQLDIRASVATLGELRAQPEGCLSERRPQRDDAFRPAVSVVIPVLDDRRVLRALDSLYTQEDVSLEVIVKDGGSSRELIRSIANHPCMPRVMGGDDRGIFDAINKGIQASTGDVIGLLGADDELADDHVVSDALAHLRINDADGCYGDMVYVDADGRIVRYWRSGRFRTHSVRLGWHPPHFATFLRRSVYERFGLYRTDYMVGADYEFFVRCLAASGSAPRLAYLPRILLVMRLGGNSNRSLGAVLRANFEAYDAWRSNGQWYAVWIPIVKPARKAFQFVRRPNGVGVGEWVSG